MATTSDPSPLSSELVSLVAELDRRDVRDLGGVGAGNHTGTGDVVEDFMRRVRARPRMSREEEVELGARIEEAEREVVQTALSSPIAQRVAAELEEELGAPPAQETLVEAIMARLTRWGRRLGRGDGPDPSAVALIEEQAGMAADDIRARHARLVEAERRSAAAKADLVEGHLRLVVWIARRFLGRGLSLADLIQEGNIGLLNASTRFDPRRGRFSTYATWWIRQAIQLALQQHVRTIRLPGHRVEGLRRVGRARRDLVQRLGREPSAGEVAAEAGLDEAEYDDLMGWSRRVVSLEAPLGEDADDSLGDRIADPKAELPAAVAMAAELSSETQAQLASLSPREQEILRLRFGLGDGEELTLEEIGSRLGITRERVRQIEAAALHKLRHPSRLQTLRFLREGHP